MAQFKFIFWWEWAHRFLGRFIGFAFAVPFLVFLVQRRFSWTLAAPLAGLFVLGGLQGALGWWMVSSGLGGPLDVVAVPARRASVRRGAAVHRADLGRPPARAAGRRDVASGRAALARRRAAARPVLLQIVAGAFVAGLDAGHGLQHLAADGRRADPVRPRRDEPWWRNLFENALTVQFVHRCIAYVIVLYVGFAARGGRARAGGFAGVHGWLPRIALLILLQVALGIATLLLRCRCRWPSATRRWPSCWPARSRRISLILCAR